MGTHKTPPAVLASPTPRTKQAPLLLWLFLVTNTNFLTQLEAGTMDDNSVLSVTFSDTLPPPPAKPAQTNLAALAGLLNINQGDVQTLLQKSYLNLAPTDRTNFKNVSTQFQLFMSSSNYDPMECGVAGITKLMTTGA